LRTIGGGTCGGSTNIACSMGKSLTSGAEATGPRGTPGSSSDSAAMVEHNVNANARQAVTIMDRRFFEDIMGIGFWDFMTGIGSVMRNYSML
jgi:hypothetical protein